MNAADRLYGITMQEKGVSTLVSVDLVEDQLTQLGEFTWQKKRKVFKRLVSGLAIEQYRSRFI